MVSVFGKKTGSPSLGSLIGSLLEPSPSHKIRREILEYFRENRKSFFIKFIDGLFHLTLLYIFFSGIPKAARGKKSSSKFVKKEVICSKFSSSMQALLGRKFGFIIWVVVVRSVGILCFANSMPRIFIREVLPPPPIKVKIWLSARPRREERLWLKKFFFKIKLPCEKINKIKNDFSNIRNQIFDLDFVR